MVNNQTEIAIAVVHGDEATGVRSGHPKSKQPRGEQSFLLVESNERQMSLPYVTKPLPAKPEQVTYWLLMFSDGDQEVRAELSLAVGLSEDHRLAYWKERIILSIPNLDLEPLRRDIDEEPPLEVQVDVHPKVR